MGSENNQTTKVCSKCGRELSVDNFYANASAKDGLQAHCKECHKAAQKASYKRKSERVLALPQPRVVEGGNPDLARFTPRQLIDELRVRGYEGELHYTYVIRV